MHVMPSRTVGDLLILGNPGAKLGAGLEVIAGSLHSSFDELRMLPADYSRMSCIQAAMTARDFLNACGINSIVVPVQLVVTVVQPNKPRIIYTIGQAGNHMPEGEEWKGHLVTLCDGFLIDPALYRTVEIQPVPLLAMAAIPASNTPLLARMNAAGDGFSVEISWLHTAGNIGWKVGNNKRTAQVRAVVVKKMLKARRGLRRYEGQPGGKRSCIKSTSISPS